MIKLPIQNQLINTPAETLTLFYTILLFIIFHYDAGKEYKRFVRDNAMEKIKIGISACLLGEKVRYDGGHKLDPFLRDTMGKFVTYVPVCPEAESGLGVPRKAMHLQGPPSAPRLVTVDTGQDLTGRITRWSARKISELEKEDLCGFIFKSRSPSCGPRVKVYPEKGRAIRKGAGIFARTFMEHFPLIPAEDEGRLYDPAIRGNFIERIFTLLRWRETLTAGRDRGCLVDFHSRHRLLLLSHGRSRYRIMEDLIAGINKRSLPAIYREYQSLLLEALCLPATPARHANVLRRILGLLKTQIPRGEQKDIQEAIDLYRAGSVPLAAPVTLMAHYVRKTNQPDLRDQWYLNPHPLERRLRNHA